MLRECSAVRQIGQRIVVGKMRNTFFRPSAFRHVFDHTEKVLRLAITPGDGNPFGGHETHRPVRQLERVVFEQDVLAGFQDLGVARRDSVSRLLGEKIVGALANRLLARQAEELFAGPIDQHIALVGHVLYDQRDRHVLHDGVKERLGAMNWNPLQVVVH